MIEHYVVAASTYAKDIDDLFTLIFWLVGFWFVLVEGIFFWLIFKFRANKDQRGQYITGEKKSEMRWISRPHLLVLVCDIVIVAAAIRVWVDIKQDLPEAEETIRVIGQQWAWSFVHSGKDGQLGTSDDVTTVDEMHVVVDKLYHYRLESRDVLHSFSVPVFRLKQDAIPGREITGWFQPTRTGTFDIQCAEMCGIGHGLMPARIVIETQESYDQWLDSMADKRLAARQ